MSDRASEITNYNELKFSRDQGFLNKSLSIRLLIGALFFFCLFAFIHFREERVEIFELNSIAPNYLVTPVDFDFFDEEATIILKQEAVKDLGKIYALAPKQIAQRRIEFENFLIYNQGWRKYTKNSTFEEMYKGVESLEEILEEIRFTDSRTLQKMQELNISTKNYIAYTPEDLDEVMLPSIVWNYVKGKTLSFSFITPATANFIIDYFRTKPWKIEEDEQAYRWISQKIQASIPDQSIHINAGSRIIDQGDRITARHMAMQQAMKKALAESRNLWHPLTLLGSFLLTLILTGICFAYFKVNNPSILNSARELFLCVTIVLLTLGFAKATEFFLLNSKMNLIELIRYPLFVPFAAILLCSLVNAGVATFLAAFLTIVLAMTLAFDRQGFMILNFVTALVTILSIRSLKKRKEVFVVCAKAWLCAIVLLIALHFYQNSWGNFSLLTDILCTGFFLLISAILVVGLLPLLESTFRIMTDVTLTEYMDPNNDLLRRMTIDAPGTYQHSVVVGNLAEAAASAIGANGLFCRVATLYHDVGKLANPQYFTENQQGEVNLHQLLTPQESAQVILGHVTEGVNLAKKAGLPEQFIDIIKEHHGTTLVYYFYRKQLEKVGGNKDLVNESEFRYTGPKPRSKESAIIMIADSLEAAARSLDKVNEETLTELANRLIKEKSDDGQFDQSLLTLEELAIVKETLVKTLVAYGHARVKYPGQENKKNPKESIPSFEA